MKDMREKETKENEQVLREINYMKLAIKLAKKGLGKVNPNPPVGAVIVKDGKILSTGYHKYYGGNHAEREAILKAKKRGIDLSGSTMYVTLEPCDHYGKTPPCTDLIIESGIKRVVISHKDPNPVSGNGIEKLKKAGLEIEEGLLKEESAQVMKFFLKSVLKKLPFVTLKYASTLDGKIADVNGDSKWITNELKREVHRLRYIHMAILVGAQTVLKDNPELTVRFYKSGKLMSDKQPIRLVLDSEGKTLEFFNSLNVFKPSSKVYVFTRKYHNKTIINIPEHVKIVNIFEPLEILKVLHEEKIDSVLIEGGAHTFSQFLPYADEIYAFYGLKVFGKGKDLFSHVENFINSRFDFSINKFKVAQNRKEFMVVMKKCSQG